LRIEKAAKGTVHFVDGDHSAQLDVAIIISFDYSGLDVLPSYSSRLEDRQWITIAEDGSHSRNKRYKSMLDQIIKRARDEKSFLVNIPTVLGFTFSSIEELDMKLAIGGY
jgi:sigma54-dependent transcription regulator